MLNMSTVLGVVRPAQWLLTVTFILCKMSSLSNHADVVSDTAVDRVKLETKKFQRLLELLLSSRFHQFYYSPAV